MFSHRYPFVMIDRVIEIDVDQSLIGIKMLLLMNLYRFFLNMSCQELYNEAMAQAAILL